MWYMGKGCCGSTASKCGRETRDRWGVSDPRTIVHIVGAKYGTSEFLE